ncbi:mate-domain-containing protein [Coemansia spiralis]|nr:mate-domain-containing protein [Coemansia spiralis]
MSAYYRFAIPAIITVCAEWACVELVVIGASYFSAAQLARQAIVCTIMVMTFQVNDGLGFGTSPCIGNLIGAAKPHQARVTADVPILVSFVIGIAGMLLLLLFGKQYLAIYTDDPVVVAKAIKLIPLISGFIVTDGLNSVLSAILRGLGRQNASANSFLFGYYACAIPLGIYFGYIRQLETIGFWWGICTGSLVTCVFQITYIYWTIDWKEEVHQ